MMKKLIFAVNLLLVVSVLIATVFFTADRYRDKEASPDIQKGLDEKKRMVTTRTEIRTPRFEYRQIVQEDMFKTGLDGDTILAGEHKIPSSACMDVILLGTVITVGGKDLALLRDPERYIETFYKEGSGISGARLVKVFRDCVVIEVDGHNQVLEMREKAAADRFDDR
jgi:hypothetical protein